MEVNRISDAESTPNNSENLEEMKEEQKSSSKELFSGGTLDSSKEIIVDNCDPKTESSNDSLGKNK